MVKRPNIRWNHYAKRWESYSAASRTLGIGTTKKAAWLAGRARHG